MDTARKIAATERGGIAYGEYRLGLEFYKKKQWKSAARHFALADRKSCRGDENYLLYTSYHGLSLVYSGDVSGLNFCRNAAAAETIKVEVFRNLTLAELFLNHRRRAYNALVSGLKIDPQHAGLLRLKRKMGVRRQPSVPFLRRNNPLNKWLGQMTYKRANRTKSVRLQRR